MEKTQKLQVILFDTVPKSSYHGYDDANKNTVAEFFKGEPKISANPKKYFRNQVKGKNLKTSKAI